MKYIVAWLIIQTSIGNCPDTLKENEFGVAPKTYMSCAVLHLSKKEIKKEKEFSNRTEALTFLKNLKTYSNNQKIGFNYLGDDIINEIKIDSIKIK